MILPDANLLLYAYHPRAPRHEASKRWLEAALSGSGLVRFAWTTLWAFLRISTNPRVFERPLSMSEASGHVSSWLQRENSGIVEPGERYWTILRRVLDDAQCSGPLGHGCGFGRHRHRGWRDAPHDGSGFFALFRLDLGEPARRRVACWRPLPHGTAMREGRISAPARRGQVRPHYLPVRNRRATSGSHATALGFLRTPEGTRYTPRFSRFWRYRLGLSAPNDARSVPLNQDGHRLLRRSAGRRHRSRRRSGDPGLSVPRTAAAARRSSAAPRTRRECRRSR